MQSNIKQRFIKKDDLNYLNQGDILRDAVCPIVSFQVGEKLDAEVYIKPLKYAVIINQDCDLEQDCKNRERIKSPQHDSGGDVVVRKPINKDKFLPNILLLPGYLVTEFKDGKHNGSDWPAEKWDSDQWKEIKRNHNIRFYYIEENTEFQIPQLVIDFKHVYSMKIESLSQFYRKWYLASMNELFREDLSIRFCNYLGRIGLPEIV